MHLLSKLKIVIVFFIGCLFYVTTSFSEDLAETQKTYIVGVVPQFATKKIFKIWRPILDHLETETGYRFKLQGSPSISQFEKEFLAGKFDFVYMNPYHLAWSNLEVGYKPLIRDHSKRLHGVLVVRKDDPIKDVKELDGKTIAFPSPNALGASLLIRAELHHNFNIKIIPKYVNSHDLVYLNTVLNQTAAGGGVQKTLNRQKDTIKNKLRVLYRTQKVAPHPFSYHPRVDEAVAMKVKQIMLQMGSEEKTRELLFKIPIKKIGTAAMNDYLPLLKMGLEEFRVD